MGEARNETGGEEANAAMSRRRLCSVVAKSLGEDPVGTAWAVERMLLVEVPLPWPYDYREARGLPPGLADVVTAMWDDHPTAGLLFVAPEPGLRRDGLRRVVDFAYPTPPRARAERSEFLVPVDAVTDFVAARLAGDAASAAAVPGVEPQAFAGRDLLVCTHGTVDACCALFGYPGYRRLRASAQRSGGRVRVWRSSHFGGHRFAPTVLEWPSGRFWGFLDNELGDALVHLAGPTAALRGCYRGWAGHEAPELQALEREAFVREGWAWCDWPQQGEIVRRDPGQGALARVAAFPPDSDPVVYTGWVDGRETLMTLGDTDGEMAAEPVWRVRDVARTPGALPH